MELELTRIFVKVVQQGSFSRAAEMLKLPKSTVSKAVTRLESETGTKLLLRTTRSLTLTAAGRAFYDACVGPVQVLEDARKSLNGADSILTGTVRITAPEDLGSQVIAPAIGELTRKHPGLTFELSYTDEVVDLVKDGFDLAVRLGRLRDTRFRAKKLGEVVLVAVASPIYLEKAPKIRGPRDLESHDCLSLSLRSSGSTRWQLRSKKETVTVDLNSRITSNQMTSLMRSAIAGAGVALVPYFLCKPEIEAGRLARVCLDWASPGIPAHLLSPLSTASSARLKLAAEHLSSALQTVLSEKT